MLPRENRLKRIEFNLTNCSPKKIYSVFSVIKYLTNINTNKYSVVVSKKYSKLAVDRNKLRRVVYSSLPKHLPIWAIIFIKPQANISDSQTVSLEISSKLNSIT